MRVADGDEKFATCNGHCKFSASQTEKNFGSIERAVAGNDVYYCFAIISNYELSMNNDTSLLFVCFHDDDDDGC